MIINFRRFPWRLRITMPRRIIRRTRPSPRHAKIVCSSSISGRVIEEKFEVSLGTPCIAHNFAIPGSGPVRQFLYLRRLVNEGCRPDFVCIEVFFFHNEGEPNEALTELKTINPLHIQPNEHDLLQRYGHDGVSLRQAQNRTLFEGLTEWRVPLQARLVPEQLPNGMPERYIYKSTPWGDRPVQKSKVLSQHREERATALGSIYRTPVESWQISPYANRVYHDMLTYCRDQGIRAMLVYMPEGTYLRSRYSPMALKQIHDFLDEMHREYQVPTVCTLDWMPDDAFVEFHHLYTDEAQTFTARLCDEHLTPWVMNSLREDNAR